MFFAVSKLEGGSSGASVAQWSECLQLKQEAFGSIPGGYPGGFSISAGLDQCKLMKDLWCSSTVRLLSTQIYMNGRVCGALVQFGCYHHRHERMLKAHPY